MTPGTLIADRYRLNRQLGVGAMGVVWAAVNVRTEREVALKLINGETDTLRRRLLREARATGRVAHRNVIEVLDVGETQDGDPFLVMPLLTGETLGERLKRDGLLQPPLAARIGADIARGLEAAHAAGIIHRDLKPANVFLHHEPGSDDDFVVKVLDFGVSKILGPGDGTTATMTGSAVGSPLYMSPEQAIGDANISPQADLWALGVLLFEMLTGTRPFYASTAFAVVAKILRGPIPTVKERAPGVAPALSAVVARCLVRRPADRIASAAELCAVLLPFAGAREHPTLPPPLPMLQPEEEADDDTAFYRKPSGAQAAEMMAAAEALAGSEPFSSGELHSSAEVLSSGDLLAASGPTGATTTGPGATMPLPLMKPAAAKDAPPPSGDLGRTVSPLVQPGGGRAGVEGDEGVDAPWSKRPRRSGLWITLAGVVAVILAGAYYLSETPAPAPKVAPAVSAMPVPPPAPSPPVTTVAAPASSPEPSPSTGVAAPPSSASTAPPVTAPAVHTQAPPAGKPTAVPSGKTGNKIIRETPF